MGQRKADPVAFVLLRIGCPEERNVDLGDLAVGNTDPAVYYFNDGIGIVGRDDDITGLLSEYLQLFSTILASAATIRVSFPLIVSNLFIVRQIVEIDLDFIQRHNFINRFLDRDHQFIDPEFFPTGLFYRQNRSVQD